MKKKQKFEKTRRARDQSEEEEEVSSQSSSSDPKHRKKEKKKDRNSKALEESARIFKPLKGRIAKGRLTVSCLESLDSFGNFHFDSD